MYLYVVDGDHFVFREHSLTLFDLFRPVPVHGEFKMSPAAQKLRHSLPKFSNLERVDDKIGKRIAVVQELGEVN